MNRPGRGHRDECNHPPTTRVHPRGGPAADPRGDRHLSLSLGSGEILDEPSATRQISGLILFHAQVRDLAELAVVLFQVLAVTGMCLSHLVPTGWWTVLGRRLFVTAMVGLGTSGTACGLYGSGLLALRRHNDGPALRAQPAAGPVLDARDEGGRSGDGGFVIDGRREPVPFSPREKVPRRGG